MSKQTLYIKGTSIVITYGIWWNDIRFSCPHGNEEENVCDDCSLILSNKLIEIGFAEWR